MRMPITSRTIKRALFAAAWLVSCHGAAWAEQRYDIKPDGSVVAHISTRETTRIRVDHDRIIDVFGDVNTTANPAGALKVSPDSSSGDIYVRPVPQADLGKPINIFVKAGHGTYTLLLKPLDVPSDTIVIRDPTTITADGDASLKAAGDWVREIKNLELAMQARKVPNGFAIKSIYQPVKLWQEVRFIEDRRVMDESLVGTEYSLTNISKQKMVIDPREFYQDGVVAVTVGRDALEPGETSSVHVIRIKEHERD